MEDNCHKNNKHKRYCLGDAKYDSKRIKDKIKEMRMIAIIYPNKRGTKYKNKLMDMKIKKEDKKRYKKRIIVENSFAWLFKNKRISRFYEKGYNSYMSFVYMSIVKLIINKMK
jgi:hypothetical protein